MMIVQILPRSFHGMKTLLAVVAICMSAFDMAARTSATQNITIDEETHLLNDQRTLIKCSIKENEPPTTAILTCIFPVNIRHAKRGINVQSLTKSKTAQDHALVLNCLWLETQSLKCTKKENYVLLHDDDVQTNLTLQIPVEEAWLYYFSCYASGLDYIKTEQCSLERKDMSSSAKDPFPLLIVIPIVIVPFVVILLVVSICLIRILIRNRYKRRIRKSDTFNEEGIRKSESAFKDQSFDEHEEAALSTNEHPQFNDEHTVCEETLPMLQDKSATFSGKLEITNKHNYPYNRDRNISASAGTCINGLRFSHSSLSFQRTPCISSKPLFEMEDRKLWMDKQCARLSSWKISTNDEQEIDRRLKKCLKLQSAIKNRAVAGYETYDRDSNWDNDDLPGQLTLQGLLIEADTTLDSLRIMQNSFIRKKVNAAIRSEVQKDMDRLQAIDNFIASARKQAHDTLAYENESEGKEIETYIVTLKTMTELEMLLEHHESCLQESIRRATSSRRAEYEKKQLELEILRDKFVDMRTMFMTNLNQALTNHALRQSSENTSIQTQDTHECLPVTGSTIPSEKMDMETKADNEQITTLDQQFPDIDTGNFIIPAKHTKQVLTTSTWIGSKPVGVLEDPTATQNSTRRHIKDLEDVQEKLHACLSRVMKTTARPDAMMAITQTSFSLYDKQAQGLLDAKVDVNDLDNMLKLKTTYSDILIVNKQRGILGGVVQSIHLTDPVKVDQELADSVSKMAKAESIIREGNKTFPKAEDVAVRMTLILPNITRKQLEGKLAKAVQNVNCLYKDEMDSENGPSNWWDASWLPRQSDTMSNNLYRNLVARFALPAIKVHSFLYKPDHDAQPNEGSIAGDDLQTERPQSTLRPEEGKLLDFDALDEAQDDVKFLYGTEGSAMTKLLHLRTQQWENHFKADTIFKLQTTEDGNDSTDLQTEHGTFKHVDMSKLYSKDPINATVVLNEEGKETLLTALCPVLPGQSHTAIHIVADKADGDAVAAVYQWLKDQDVKTIRLWAAGKEAPRNNENGRLPVQHIT